MVGVIMEDIVIQALEKVFLGLYWWMFGILVSDGRIGKEVERPNLELTDPF